MSSESDTELSDGLQQFIILAIGMGLDNLQKEGSLAPMILSAQGEEIALGILAVEDDVMGVGAEVIAELPPETDYYALLFDGKLNVEGALLKAVIVQAGERGGGQGHMVFQQYEAETFEAVGGPEYAGRVEHLPGR